MGTLPLVSEPSPIHPDALLAQAAWLHRLARAMLRNDDLAHDLAQETLVVALGKSGANVGNLRGWLQAIAKRLALRRARAEARRRRREQRLAPQEADEREGSTAERLRLHHRLCAAVLELPEPYRTAVSLRFFDDLPPRTIAQRTGATPAMVRQRVHRGLAMLRERFDADDGGRQGWQSAFVAAGLGAGTSFAAPLLSVILMKKLLAVAVLLMAGAITWWWHGSPDAGPPTPLAPIETTVQAASVPSGEPRDEGPQAPAAARTPAVAAFVVRALDADDRPIADAEVHRWRRDGTIEVARTDANGRGEFVPSPEAGGLLVRAAGHYPALQALPSLLGEVAVRLGSGRRVAGRLLEDGAPAAAGVPLRLTSISRPVTPPDAPEAIRELVSPEASMATTTDALGRFAFAGLPEDWAGAVDLPRTHWLVAANGHLAQDDTRLWLPAADEALTIETTKLPVVRGRVEWSDGSGPVMGALVLLSGIEFTDGTKAPTLGERTDAHGRFALGLTPSQPMRRLAWRDPRQRSEPTRIQVSVSSGTTTNVTLEAGGGPLDLRNEFSIRMDRPHGHSFRAVDEAGRPLAGARALQGDGTLSEPTKDDGVGSSSSPFGLLVAAPGKQVAIERFARIGQAPGQRRDIVLAPGNEILVRLRHPDGRPAPAHAISIRGDALQLDRDGTNLRRWLGESPHALLKHAFLVDRHGEARLLSLTPGVAARLAVQDHFGREVAATDLTTPALGERRVVELEIAAESRAIGGRVVDADGAPIALAEVTLVAGGDTPSTRTDGRGAFRFDPMIVGAPLSVAVERRGYAGTERTVPLDESAEQLVIQLPRGNRTTLRVVDEAGSPVDDARVTVASGNQRRFTWFRAAPGEFTWFDLPAGEVTFVCLIAGTRHELRHDTSKPVAELRVPRTALVHCERPASLPPRDGVRRRIAIAVRLDAPAEPMDLEFDDETGGAPQRLLPGRYRFELAEMWWDAEQQRTERARLGPNTTVELRAGDVQRIRFP